MAAERCRAAHLDGVHDAPLHRRHRRAMLPSIGFSVAAEHVRHFQLRTVHAASSEVLRCGWWFNEYGCGSRSRGLEAEHTLRVAIRRYRVVVAKLRWPSRS